MSASRTAPSVALLLCLSALPCAGQNVDFNGQVRPRYETRDPSDAGRDAFTSMRTRLEAHALLDGGLDAVVQLQDVRLWGEETSTVGDYRADALDLHQAFLRYRGAALGGGTATVGRQEASLGGQRLVGAVNWTQQGRSFDGVRLDLAGSSRAPVTLIAYTVGDATAPAVDADAGLYGVYATVQEVGPGALDLYGLYDRVRTEDPTRQWTFGARYAFTGPLTGRVEGSLQRGDRSGSDVDAFMVGARLGGGAAAGRLAATLWYDYLSGDADPSDGQNGAFSTLYATNHKFYGFADLFLDVPAHTAGHGLQDLALKTRFVAAPRLTIALDLHSFHAAQSGELSTGHYANELDLTVTHPYTSQLTVTAGLSLVQSDDALSEVGRPGGDTTWGYLMLDLVF